MEKIDARTLDPSTQFELRKQYIRLREKGLSNKLASEAVGLSATRCSTIWNLYQKGGLEAIKSKKRGRSYGSKRQLSAEQETTIQKALIDKTPDQLKFKFALWTRDAVRQLIKQETKVEIPLRTISEYLKRWGFTAQKPAKRAYEQNPERVQKWLDVEYPQIAHRARTEKGEIHWCDETGIHADAYNAKGFAPKGKTPVVKINSKKSKINMISSITNLGKVRFMVYRESFTAPVFIQFLSRLIKDSKQKVFLILDNHRVHHAKKVREWLEKHKENIELFFLPPYSPELNPDEYLNGNLKQKIRSGLPARSEAELDKKTRSFMKTLQRRRNT